MTDLPKLAEECEKAEGPLTKSAVLSDCLKYRYRLGRDWDRSGRTVAFVMLNPSTADASIDDPTIRRCVGFARAWGYGALVVGNLFALRATDPKALRTTSAPIGPENDEHLRRISADCAEVVCAWGRHGTLFGRDRAVLKLLGESGARVSRLSKPGADYPMHPLYLPASTPRIPVAALRAQAAGHGEARE